MTVDRSISGVHDDDEVLLQMTVREFRFLQDEVSRLSFGNFQASVITRDIKGRSVGGLSVSRRYDKWLGLMFPSVRDFLAL